jgi:hypothetical protein
MYRRRVAQPVLDGNRELIADIGPDQRARDGVAVREEEARVPPRSMSARPGVSFTGTVRPVCGLAASTAPIRSLGIRTDFAGAHAAIARPAAMVPAMNVRRRILAGLEGISVMLVGSAMAAGSRSSREQRECRGNWYGPEGNDHDGHCQPADVHHRRLLPAVFTM